MSDLQSLYQRALLRLLRDGAAPAEIQRALAEDPTLGELRDYTMALDAHALQVAVELVARWMNADPPV